MFISNKSRNLTPEKNKDKWKDLMYLEIYLNEITNVYLCLCFFRLGKNNKNKNNGKQLNLLEN